MLRVVTPTPHRLAHVSASKNNNGILRSAYDASAADLIRLARSHAEAGQHLKPLYWGWQSSRWRAALASCCSCCGARRRASPRRPGQPAGAAGHAALEGKLLARVDSREWESE